MDLKELIELKAIDCFAEIEDVLRSKLTYIAEGSSRIVFHYKDGLVLKWATNMGGVLQNENEYNAYRDSHESSVLAKVIFDMCDPDKHFIVQEAILQRPFRELSKLVNGYNWTFDPNSSKVNNDDPFIPSTNGYNLTALQKQQFITFINNIHELKVKFNIEVDDIYVDNCGVQDDVIKIVDYGYINSIVEDYCDYYHAVYSNDKPRYTYRD